MVHAAIVNLYLNDWSKTINCPGVHTTAGISLAVNKKKTGVLTYGSFDIAIISLVEYCVTVMLS
jgi:hypothetical protein